MRIVGGALRGRRFAGPPGDQTRPTSERVREAVASALHSRGAFDGAQVLDLFAGTGALAYEALSRGATRATLVEQDGKVFRALQKSAKELGLGDRITLRRADVFRAPERALAGTYDLVFLDPPYARMDELAPVIQALANHCQPGATVVIEQARHNPFSFDDEHPLCLVRRYEYGDTIVSFAEF